MFQCSIRNKAKILKYYILLFFMKNWCRKQVAYNNDNNSKSIIIELVFTTYYQLYC
jgi:hypothetical protein